MARWLAKLQEFDFKIIHRQGRNHANADALSRLPCRQCGRTDEGLTVPALVATTEVKPEQVDHMGGGNLGGTTS